MVIGKGRPRKTKNTKRTVKKRNKSKKNSEDVRETKKSDNKRNKSLVKKVKDDKIKISLSKRHQIIQFDSLEESQNPKKRKAMTSTTNPQVKRLK